MVEIRLLNENDVIEHLAELRVFMKMVLSENKEGNMDVEKLSQKYVDNMVEFTRDGSAILIGAFDDKKIVGFHWGYELDYFGERRVHSYFNAIYPEYRGQKIGSRFFRKLEEEALARDIHVIEAMCVYSNKGAVNYHLNNGFEIEKLKVFKKL